MLSGYKAQERALAVNYPLRKRKARERRTRTRTWWWEAVDEDARLAVNPFRFLIT